MTIIERLSKRIVPLQEKLSRYPELWEMFKRCFLNTVETTIRQEQGDTFVITGDIHAMWLRDSTAQVLHYLRFADDEVVAEMIEGLIARQAKCVLRDPYANAFNREESDYKPFDDWPRASDWVWERKYEIDSLCYPLWLADLYMKKTGSTTFLTDEFHQALKTIVSVFRQEQDHASSSYFFQRDNCPPSDTLTCEGKGEPVAHTGMTWSGFRPSDDACKYGYLIPSNLFAVRVLSTADKLAEAMNDETLAFEIRTLRTEIAEGIDRYAKTNVKGFGEIYAYEVDGLGNTNLMDDANVPSLMSLPYLEVCEKDDPLYLRTRGFVLSGANPYYYEGTLANGVGSPHTPHGYIWPIALCMQAITSNDVDEKAKLLHMLMHTHAGTSFMHESFDPNDPNQFTRSWFAWANSMFAEMLLRTYEEGLLDTVITRALELDQY